MQQASTIMQDITEGLATGEGPETVTDVQVHSIQGDPVDIETDTDNLLQGGALTHSKRARRVKPARNLFSYSYPCGRGSLYDSVGG